MILTYIAETVEGSVISKDPAPDFKDPENLVLPMENSSWKETWKAVKGWHVWAAVWRDKLA